MKLNIKKPQTFKSSHLSLLRLCFHWEPCVRFVSLYQAEFHQTTTATERSRYDVALDHFSLTLCWLGIGSSGDLHFQSAPLSSDFLSARLEKTTKLNLTKLDGEVECRQRTKPLNQGVESFHFVNRTLLDWLSSGLTSKTAAEWPIENTSEVFTLF